MSDLFPFNDENELLRHVADGDEKAFRLVFNKYHQKLGTHIFRITKSHELAEEVVQDVFLKIWQNRSALLEVKNFQGYLYVISKNHALNCLKKIAQERTVTTELEEIIYDLRVEDAEDNERYELIDEAIDHLPPQQRQVYLLSRHERLQYAEIAVKMNLSRETVKKYLQISSESISCYIRKKLVISILVILFYFV